MFYYNPNIFPREEYELRKSENMRFAESVGATDVMFAVSGFTACGPVYSYIEGLLS